jgi:pSer/pThr/pTyr-binding forkhead associated (FHA) protein
MALKTWILQKMNRIGRPDLPQRASRPAPISGRAGAEPREPSLRGLPETQEPAPPGPEHLGAYGPLIGAIRDELEHFVASELRLHLAIAERDRYVLTSIEVDCADDADGADLLQRFTEEFTPEQTKRFLARDVIGRLPNASAIDLTQFGGLNATRLHGDLPVDDDAYAELRAQLRASAPGEAAHSFDVTLLGRWTELEPGAAATRAAEAKNVAAPHTPLAGSRMEIEIDDADGHRRLTLSSVVPNRRYAIGKGEGCDIAVNGTFASRRHCEIWLENGSWWAGDAGSTNGIRVETAHSVLGRAGVIAGGANAKTVIEIVPGARIVLSALARGEPGDYPRVLLNQGEAVVAPATPVSPADKAPTTAITPIAVLRQRGRETTRELTLTASMASGTRTLTLGAKPVSVPVTIGRSRSQDLVVDWAHEGVSGHHIDIMNVDDTGAEVAVHGDNGVTVEGTAHPQGHRFRWRVNERMTLGRASGEEPECTLMLSGRS